MHETMPDYIYYSTDTTRPLAYFHTNTPGFSGEVIGLGNADNLFNNPVPSGGITFERIVDREGEVKDWVCNVYPQVEENSMNIIEKATTGPTRATIESALTQLSQQTIQRKIPTINYGDPTLRQQIEFYLPHAVIYGARKKIFFVHGNKAVPIEDQTTNASVKKTSWAFFPREIARIFKEYEFEITSSLGERSEEIVDCIHQMLQRGDVDDKRIRELINPQLFIRPLNEL